jgi:hypothetical protein
MNTGKNANKNSNKKDNKAANTSAPASATATPAAETTNSNIPTEGEEPAAGASEPASETTATPADATTSASETTVTPTEGKETAESKEPAAGASEAASEKTNTPAEGKETAAGASATVEIKKKARIPLAGIGSRSGGGGGGKTLGNVYNIAEVMYGHITTKTRKGEKETAIMHHIINGEAIFEIDAASGQVMIDFKEPGDKLYSFVANVNNKTNRKTSLYKEVEGDVEVIDAKGNPVLNADGTPKTEKGMVPAPGCAWHGFIVATPENAAKVYNNIKAMLENPLTEGSAIREQIKLLEPPFNLHSGAASTLSLEPETA